MNTPARLKDMVLLKLNTTIWNQDDIREAAQEFRSPDLQSRATVEDKVKEKVSELPLPKRLKDEILDLNDQVGSEIENWLRYHMDVYELPVSLPKEFCWTPQGTVDMKKTALAHVRNESVDMVERYKMACFYCFERHILDLWNRLPECWKSYFRFDELDEYEVMVRRELVAFWAYVTQDEMDRLDKLVHKIAPFCSRYQYGFQCATNNGNRSATEFFWHKLTLRERAESIANCVPKVANLCSFSKTHYDVMHFLFSNMDMMQKAATFLSLPCGMFSDFMDRSCQELFSEITNYMLLHLTSPVRIHNHSSMITMGNHGLSALRLPRKI